MNLVTVQQTLDFGKGLRLSVAPDTKELCLRKRVGSNDYPGDGRTLPPLRHAEFVRKMDEWLKNGAACPD